MPNQDTPSPRPSDSIPDPGSHLSPELQKIVRDPVFIEWFGDWQNDPNSPNTSKIIDEKTGEPALFYHGTNRNFNDIPRLGHESQKYPFSNIDLDHDYEGIYVTGSKEFAVQYADPLGASWDETMSTLASRFNITSWPDVFDIWNGVLISCQGQDGNVTIENDGNIFNLTNFEELVRDKKISYSSALLYKGKSAMWIGEYLQLIGGQLPTQETELAPYTSLYTSVQETVTKLEAAGNKLLVPANAEPRILPVFVKSLKPVEIKVNSSGMQSMDTAFAEGFDVIHQASDNNYDSVISDGHGTVSGINIAVLSPDQLYEVQI